MCFTDFFCFASNSAELEQKLKKAPHCQRCELDLQMCIGLFFVLLQIRRNLNRSCRKHRIVNHVNWIYKCVSVIFLFCLKFCGTRTEVEKSTALPTMRIAFTNVYRSFFALNSVELQQKLQKTPHCQRCELHSQMWIGHFFVLLQILRNLNRSCQKHSYWKCFILKITYCSAVHTNLLRSKWNFWINQLFPCLW